MTFSRGKKRKITKVVKARMSGLLLGGLVTWSVMNVYYTKELAKVSMKYSTNTTATQVNSSTNNLLYQEVNGELASNNRPEVTIAGIHQSNEEDSNLTSTTIKIANSKSKNTLISDAIARAEVREDGNLIKIVNIEDDIIKPHSIESLSFDFPLSTDAKELKIEVYSPVDPNPISAKTFDLVSSED